MALQKRYLGTASVGAVGDLYIAYQTLRASIAAWIRNQETGSVVFDLLHDHADRTRSMVEELVQFVQREFPELELPDCMPAIEALADGKPGVG